MKSKTILCIAAACLCVVVAFSGGLFLGGWFSGMGGVSGDAVTISRGDYELYQKFSRIDEIQQLIDAYYYAEYDQQTLFDHAAKGYVAGLGDIYADYYTPQEVADLYAEQEGNYVGIGVLVTEDASGYVRLLTVYRDTPALEAGLKAGDLIYMVEGEDVFGVDMNEVVSRIKGEEGTSVNISVLRGSDVLDFTVERRQVIANHVSYEMLDHNIGYIYIESFMGDDVELFHEAIDKLTGQGMEALVIDLRNNGGGYVTDVVAIADTLLPSGTIFYSEDKYGARMTEKSDAKALELPLAVVVNECSASASEILAGSLQDHGAATIVGVTTFGKGIVQTQIPFDDGAALKITTSYYYLPSGRCIHEQGITPDVTIETEDGLPANPYALEHEDDVQLQKAIDVLLDELS